MGKNANKRTAEDRKAYAQVLQDDSWEVVFRIKEAPGQKVEVNLIIRDEEPDENNLAHIFAQYLHANMGSLIQDAVDGHRAYKARIAAGMSHEQAANAPALELAEAPRRSILGADGNIARKTDDVNLVLPPGVAQAVHQEKIKRAQAAEAVEVKSAGEPAEPKMYEDGGAAD